MKKDFRVKTLILLYLFFLVSCSTSSYGLEEELPVVERPVTEVVNQGSKIIAHRGAWKENNLPQNSVAALKKALAMDLYGVECDVRETKDGKLVICHDATHDGLKIASNDYKTLSQHPLANGEPLPLLDDFLYTLASDHGQVRLVIELKDCSVARLLELVEQYDVLDRVDFISFSSGLCSKLVTVGLGYKTLFLGGTLSPQDVQALGFGGIDYASSVYQAHPEWITEATTLGMKVWVWTVNSSQAIREYTQQGVYVTTDIP